MSVLEPDPERASVCLSDLHLVAPTEPAFKTLEAITQSVARAGHNLFLLGDLCEVWIGDDDDGPLANAFRELLARLGAQTFVGLMHGNRDFLFGEQLASDTHSRLLADPYPFGDHILLAHGDAFCTDDTAYQQVRAMFRSSQWQDSVLAQSLPERRQLAASLRAQSADANANKAQNIMDVNAQAVAQAMQESGRRLLVHGHTHRPGRHQHPGFERVVLGDWGRTAWIATLKAGLSIGAQSEEQLTEGTTLTCLPLEQP